MLIRVDYILYAIAILFIWYGGWSLADIFVERMSNNNPTTRLMLSIGFLLVGIVLGVIVYNAYNSNKKQLPEIDESKND